MVRVHKETLTVARAVSLPSTAVVVVLIVLFFVFVCECEFGLAVTYLFPRVSVSALTVVTL